MAGREYFHIPSRPFCIYVHIYINADIRGGLIHYNAIFPTFAEAAL